MIPCSLISVSFINLLIIVALAYPTSMLLPALLLAATSYSTSVEQWRQAHEAKVRAEDGWLSYAGLFWLHEGSNEIPQAGVFEFRNGVVIWQGRPLKPDNPGPADVGTLGR